jgi:glycosyltransferase involved in cell wall biosynthesis
VPSIAHSGALTVVQTVVSLDRAASGLSAAVSNLADALEEAGSRVTVVFTAGGNASQSALPRRASAAPVRAFRVGGRTIWAKNFSAAIRRAAQGADRKLIHDNGLWTVTNFLAAHCAALERMPLVISPHGMLEPWALEYRPWRKKLAWALGQRAILKRAAMFVVNSEKEAHSVRRAGFKQPIAIVPLGVSMPVRRSVHAEKAPIRQILFLSRIHPSKGLLLLVEAWSRVRPPGWKVIIAGPDEIGHRAQLERAIAERHLTDGFEFVGEVSGERKEKVFWSADIFVLPSYSENFGLVIPEAMSYGLPVLTTKGTPWAVLESIGAGWWVEPNIDGIESGLRGAVAATREMRAAMGQAGRKYAENHLTWQSAANKATEAYDWLFSDRRRRPAHLQLFVDDS